MKKMTLMVCAAAFGLAATAGQDNLLLKFSTPGPDTYADGATPVADGEFYALVWVKKGATFAGFNADGSVADADNSAVICAVPFAEGGRCPLTTVEIDRVLADAYAGAGSFELHVLDTRDAEGKPKGETALGVNASGAAQSFSLAVDAEGKVVQDQTVAAKKATLAATATALPPSIPQPKITSIKVEDGLVKLTVKGTSKLLRYGVITGDTPDDLAPLPVSAGVADGDDFGEIEIAVPAEKGGRFFKVGRAGLE